MTYPINLLQIEIEEVKGLSLVDYAANQARTEMSRLSISRAIRKVKQEKLAESNYYPRRGLERVPPLLGARGRTTYSDNSDSLLIQHDFQDDAVRLSSSSSSSYLADVRVK